MVDMEDNFLDFDSEDPLLTRPAVTKTRLAFFPFFFIFFNLITTGFLGFTFFSVVLQLGFFIP